QEILIPAQEFPRTPDFLTDPRAESLAAIGMNVRVAGIEVSPPELRSVKKSGFRLSASRRDNLGLMADADLACLNLGLHRTSPA
ncbi:MAG: hypothetical protein M3R62_11440, partial [Acidobacteriota bacterium]|nr:hypothetical protein [Acidobacteriota bacterium]